MPLRDRFFHVSLSKKMPGVPGWTMRLFKKLSNIVSFLEHKVKSKWVIPLTCWSFKLILKALNNIKLSFFCKPYESEFSILWLFSNCSIDRWTSISEALKWVQWLVNRVGGALKWLNGLFIVHLDCWKIADKCLFEIFLSKDFWRYAENYRRTFFSNCWALLYRNVGASFHGFMVKTKMVDNSEFAFFC